MAELSYGRIYAMVIDERHAGATPDHAATSVIDRMGPKQMRSALHLLLASLAREIPVPQPKPIVVESVEMRPAAPVLVQAKPSKEEIAKRQRAVKAAEETRRINQERAVAGLDPLVRHEGKLMTWEDHRRKIDERKAERVRERDLRRAKKAGFQTIDAHRSWNKRKEAERVEMDAAGGPLAWAFQRIQASAEEYAREAFGDKIWTGSEWVSIFDADNAALTGAIGYHEREAEMHSEQATYHRRQADRLSRLKAVLPANGKVADMEPTILQAVAA